MTIRSKIIKLAASKPPGDPLRAELLRLVQGGLPDKDHRSWAPYQNDIDHGYDQPLSGGHDIMKRLQDQLRIEQGREPREKNPRLASTEGGTP